MNSADVDSMLKALTQKDLRVQLRARGESPAGGIESLRERLKEVMVATKDFALKNDDGSDMPTVHIVAGLASSDLSAGNLKNNYVRPSGQNVGNFLTERCSSRVLAPPGGGSQVRVEIDEHLLTPISNWGPMCAFPNPNLPFHSPPQIQFGDYVDPNIAKVRMAGLCMHAGRNLPLGGDFSNTSAQTCPFYHL